MVRVAHRVFEATRIQHRTLGTNCKNQIVDAVAVHVGNHRRELRHQREFLAEMVMDEFVVDGGRGGARGRRGWLLSESRGCDEH